MGNASKVVPTGKIRLGGELRLIRTLPPSTGGPRLAIRPAGPQRVNPARLRSPGPQTGIGVDVDRLEYMLERSGGEITIDDEGLCQAYGIFGVPGCGKTYLLLYMLRQIAAHHRNDSESKFGALILDPKGALYEDIRNIVREAGRESDLLVLNERVMEEGGYGINVLRSFLDPRGLGQALALAARSAGIDSKEEYWMNEVGAILGAGLQITDLMARRYDKVPTLSDLASLLLSGDLLDTVLADAKETTSQWTAQENACFEIARGILERFRNDKDHAVLSSFIEQSYGIFRYPQYGMFSPAVSFKNAPKSLYDDIVDNGRIVLVSVSKRSLAISKILCTAVKTLFQQTVLTRLDRFRSGELANFTRPLLFLVDEYSDVATELQSQPMGDGLFFSQMRQFGCMGIIATQSVQMLKSSALKETWEAIFGNLAAKIFMQLGDPETAEMASKLVGESEYRFQTFDRTFGKDGASQTVHSELREKKDLPTRLLLQTLKRGQALVVGSTDGRSQPSARFVSIASRD